MNKDRHAVMQVSFLRWTDTPELSLNYRSTLSKRDSMGAMKGCQWRKINLARAKLATNRKHSRGSNRLIQYNKPILSKLKRHVCSTLLSVVAGMDCYHSWSPSGKFHHGFALEKFAKQFSDLLFRGGQSPLADCGRSIHAANFPSKALLIGAEQPLFFQSVEYWVQCSWAELVTVPRQLFDHAQTEDSLLCCVVKNVEADEARIELPGIHKLLFGCSHYRIPLSISPIAYR